MIGKGSYVRANFTAATAFKGQVGVVTDVTNDGSGALVKLATMDHQAIWYHLNEVIEITEREYAAEQALRAFGIDRVGGRRCNSPPI